METPSGCHVQDKEKVSQVLVHGISRDQIASTVTRMMHSLYLINLTPAILIIYTGSALDPEQVSHRPVFIITLTMYYLLDFGAILLVRDEKQCLLKMY